jgi:hypothetical protein
VHGTTAGWIQELSYGYGGGLCHSVMESLETAMRLKKHNQLANQKNVGKRNQTILINNYLLFISKLI